MEAEHALVPRERPAALDYLHQWFLELERGRQYSQAGLQPFSWEMVEAWMRVMRHDPSPEDIDALFALDVVTRFPDAGQEAGHG